MTSLRANLFRTISVLRVDTGTLTYKGVQTSADHLRSRQFYPGIAPVNSQCAPFCQRTFLCYSSHVYITKVRTETSQTISGHVCSRNHYHCRYASSCCLILVDPSLAIKAWQSNNSQNITRNTEERWALLCFTQPFLAIMFGHVYRGNMAHAFGLPYFEKQKRRMYFPTDYVKSRIYHEAFWVTLSQSLSQNLTFPHWDVHYSELLGRYSVLGNRLILSWTQELSIFQDTL